MEKNFYIKVGLHYQMRSLPFSFNIQNKINTARFIKKPPTQRNRNSMAARIKGFTPA
jgi:hypothetical protein